MSKHAWYSNLVTSSNGRPDLGLSKFHSSFSKILLYLWLCIDNEHQIIGCTNVINFTETSWSSKKKYNKNLLFFIWLQEKEEPNKSLTFCDRYNSITVLKKSVDRCRRKSSKILSEKGGFAQQSRRQILTFEVMMWKKHTFLKHWSKGKSDSGLLLLPHTSTTTIDPI